MQIESTPHLEGHAPWLAPTCCKCFSLAACSAYRWCRPAVRLWHTLSAEAPVREAAGALAATVARSPEGLQDFVNARPHRLPPVDCYCLAKGTAISIERACVRGPSAQGGSPQSFGGGGERKIDAARCRWFDWAGLLMVTWIFTLCSHCRARARPHQVPSLSRFTGQSTKPPRRPRLRNPSRLAGRTTHGQTSWRRGGK